MAKSPGRGEQDCELFAPRSFVFVNNDDPVPGPSGKERVDFKGKWRKCGRAVYCPPNNGPEKYADIPQSDSKIQAEYCWIDAVGEVSPLGILLTFTLWMMDVVG